MAFISRNQSCTVRASFLARGTSIPRKQSASFRHLIRSVFRGGWLSIAAAFLGSTSTWAQDSPLFHFVGKAGPHSVGLRIVEQYDYSRTYRPAIDNLGKPFHGERARPLQTLIWYPAERNGAKPMTVGDYQNLIASETSFGNPKRIAYAKELASLKPTLAMALWAIRDAPALPGRFPVVIYAPSGIASPSWENADLCEYLASYGYIVIASPAMGATTRDITIDLDGANTQARDISFLIGYARTLPNADNSAVAVAGFSWGGISSLFAAARDNRIDALVSLDGSLRYFPGLVKQAGDIHPEEMTIPLLSFEQHDFPLEIIQGSSPRTVLDGPNVLNAWTHGDLFTVHMLGLFHTQFSSMFQRDEDTWWTTFHVFPMMQGDYGREDSIAGYAWVATYTLRFLDAYLKHDVQAMSFLKKTPAENGVPRHFMAVSYRAAAGSPASFDSFRAEIGRSGFDHIGMIYEAMRKERADFKLEENTVNAWSDELISNGNLPEAIELLKLNVVMYPESSDAYASLGDAYLQAGRKPLAIETLKESLKRNAQNYRALRILSEIEH
jgi:Chlorophyllase